MRVRIGRRLLPAALMGFLLLLAVHPSHPARSGASASGGLPPLSSSSEGIVVSPAAGPPGPIQLVPSLLAKPPRVSNGLLVRQENEQRGTTAWRLTNYAAAGEIQAYAGDVSVNAGGALTFYVSTRIAGTPYRIDFYRMGWYGGAGARLLGSAAGLTGSEQGYYTTASGIVDCRRCTVDLSTGLVDAGWLPSYQLKVPTTWLSGVYLALLTDNHGKQTYVPFVVRQDERPSALLLKTSVNTYEAYNAWGGRSLYGYNSTGANTVGGGPGAVKVSFNRPYEADFGAGHFLRYEYNLVRWLERSGYDVSYTTDKDVDASGGALLLHRGFISAGHDEYWSARERQNVEQALAHGVHLAFLSGDAVYWQARYEPSATGEASRILVEYRGPADPLFKTDPARATVRWQDPPVNNSESLLTGTVYSGQTEPFTQDWVVASTGSWLFAGTGLKPADHVAGLVGKEFDRAEPGEVRPPDLRVLSHSLVKVPTTAARPADVSVAETTIYTAASGALVFSAGTVTWSWGLDDASFPLGPALHNTPVSAAIQRLTRNLLDAIAFGPPGPP